MTFNTIYSKYHGRKSIFDVFTCLIKGVAGSGVGSGRRDLGLTIGCAIFSKFFRHNPALIDHSELSAMMPQVFRN